MTPSELIDAALEAMIDLGEEEDWIAAHWWAWRRFREDCPTPETFRVLYLERLSDG